MGNPIPVITEAVNDNLGTWLCEDPHDFADLIGSLPDLAEALHDGLKKAIEGADPDEHLVREVHDDLESLLAALSRVAERAGEASENFERCYGFWLGRE
jgi:hypothetical protein